MIRIFNILCKKKKNADISSYIVVEQSLIVFAEVCLKLFTVVLNGFDGHKDGYNNITVHTVNYVNNQCSLMQQALQYVEEHPKNDN